MSLTRKEWEEMWERVKEMENYSNKMRVVPLFKHIDWIKIKIQQVIGQME